MPNPTVSILTTCFNRAKFLGECIESVQQSKYKDYEHIIVDDCSTDESVAIAQQYAKRDKKIKVFINDKNLGDYPNRNRAAHHASGQYLKYLDADDLHGPYILDVFMDAMLSYPDAGLGLNVHGNSVSHVAQCVTSEAALQLHYTGNVTIFNRSPLGAIIKRDAFDSVGGFPEKQHVGDHELWHKLATHFPLVLLPSKLAHYRYHEDQQSQDNRTDLRVPFKYYDAAIRGLKYDRDNKVSREFQKSIERIIRKRQARTIFVLIRRLKFHSALQLQQLSGLKWRQLLFNAFS